MLGLGLGLGLGSGSGSGLGAVDVFVHLGEAQVRGKHAVVH